ncbi:DUF4123 domain-containing protein [Tamilnaduibacter salinus]|nr:DUF4123 domain-containing protein [Tamilnaduibacter salinus]
MSMVDDSRIPVGQPTFRDGLAGSHVSPGDRCLLVVDAAQYDSNEVLATVYANDDDPHWCWLFENSTLKDHATAGPLVVETTADSKLVTAVNEHYADSGLLYLFTRLPTTEALAGWRTALHGDLPERGSCALRSYDSRFLTVINRVWPDWLASLIPMDMKCLWSVDWHDDLHWVQSLVSAGDKARPEPVWNERLEMSLGWADAWSRMQRLPGSSLEEGLRFIRHQCEAIVPCPDQDSELIGQWQAYVAYQTTDGTERRSRGLNEKDVEPCQR